MKREAASQQGFMKVLGIMLVYLVHVVPDEQIRRRALYARFERLASTKKRTEREELLSRERRTLNLSKLNSEIHHSCDLGLNQSTHELEPVQHHPSSSVLPSGCLHRMSRSCASL